MKRRLERVPLPDDRAAEERAWDVVRAAYEEREPVAWAAQARASASRSRLWSAWRSSRGCDHGRPGSRSSTRCATSSTREGRRRCERAPRDSVRLPAPGRLLLDIRGRNLDRPGQRLQAPARALPHGVVVAARVVRRRRAERLGARRDGNRTARFTGRSRASSAWRSRSGRTRASASRTSPATRVRVITGDGARDWGLGCGRRARPTGAGSGTHARRGVGRQGRRRANCERRRRTAADTRPRDAAHRRARVERRRSPRSPARSSQRPSGGHGSHRNRRARRGAQPRYVDDRLVFSGAGVMNSVAVLADEQWLVVGGRRRPARLRAPAPAAALYAVSNVTRQFGANATVHGWCCTP